MCSCARTSAWGPPKNMCLACHMCAYSVGATVPVELHTIGAHWCSYLRAIARHGVLARRMLQHPLSCMQLAHCGTCCWVPLRATTRHWAPPRRVLQYPLSVPCVYTGCSPLHATTVPRVPAMHGEGKSPPTDESEIG